MGKQQSKMTLLIFGRCTSLPDDRLRRRGDSSHADFLPRRGDSSHGSCRRGDAGRWGEPPGLSHPPEGPGASDLLYMRASRLYTQQSLLWRRGAPKLPAKSDVSRRGDSVDLWRAREHI